MEPLSELVQTLSCAQCDCGMREPEVERQIQERIDQEKQALKDEFIKKVKESNLSGLSKATVYALITQL